MSKATFNWKRINNDFLTLVNNSFDAITWLAGREVVLAEAKQKVTDEADDMDLTADARKRYIAKWTKDERKAVSDAKQKASDMCFASVVRYVNPTDVSDVYHMDIEAFLRNIGVVNGEGKLNNSAMKRVVSLKQEVTDRVRVSITKRKAGENKLTHGTTKDVANNSIDLMLAIIEAMQESNCFELTSYGFSVVSDEATDEAGSEAGKQDEAGSEA